MVPALLDLYSIVVLAAVVMSWIHVDRRHPLVAMVFKLTEPVLAPLRRALPPVAGLDLSPLVLLIALRVLRQLW
jgi:YggT family protein